MALPCHGREAAVSGSARKPQPGRATYQTTTPPLDFSSSTKNRDVDRLVGRATLGNSKLLATVLSRLRGGAGDKFSWGARWL